MAEIKAFAIDIHGEITSAGTLPGAHSDFVPEQIIATWVPDGERWTVYDVTLSDSRDYLILNADEALDIAPDWVNTWLHAVWPGGRHKEGMDGA